MCNVIEDEAHFLLSCNLFVDDRLQLYDDLNLQDNMDNSELLPRLLSSNNQRHLELVGKFIYACFKKRRVYIESVD